MAERMNAQAVHRSGPLKQSNKPHKHGKHQSKGRLDTAAKGRVSLKSQSRRHRGLTRKVDRRNQLKQLRSNKRHEALAAKRMIGVEGTPPHLLVVIPLSPSVDLPQIHRLLSRACDPDLDDALPYSLLTTLTSSQLKHRFTLVFPPSSNLYSLLDCAKVADTLVFVYSPDEVELSSSALLTVNCCSSQGLPSTFHLVQGLDKLSAKNSAGVRKALQKTIEKRFPSDKLHSMSSEMDACNVLRYLSGQKRRPVASRDSHPHLLTERAEFVPSVAPGEECSGTLKLSGYLRGRPLSVNGLVYIPGVGEFQMAQIDSSPDPHQLKPRCVARSNAMDLGSEEGMDEDTRVLEVADPAKQESLESEVTLDPMEGEQTWPTEEELRDASVSSLERVGGGRGGGLRRVPRGTSDYQAAWIAESGSEEEQSDGGSEDGDLPAVLSPCEGVGVGSEDEEVESEDEEMSSAAADTATDTLTAADTEQYDAQMDIESEHRQLERLRAEREDHMFPDEVDTPLGVDARIRFQRFRGLKSFRSSPWDPKENLPRDYARIFQFENFSRTKKIVLSENEGEGVLPGWFVTVHVSNVPSSFADSLDVLSSPLVVFGLLQHENKMSVIHFALRRTGGYTAPIRSKDQLVFHCGVRRYACCPIFSQHTVGDKHKHERFFHNDGVCVASVFAPVGYPPQPVLVFKPEQGSHILVAVGSLYKVDPDRVVCKRIVLSGHPFKINRKSAVVRYMFFNRDDILWFKPVELRTKHGRRGHIKEPLGTRGHMKCVFDGQLKAQDTVLMNLYKRVFPKWTYTLSIPSPKRWSEEKPAEEKEEGGMV